MKYSSIYRRLIEKLTHWKTHLLDHQRPDICFPVQILSQFMANPTTYHWEASLKILKYLKNTSGPGITYKRNLNFKFSVYYDSD